MLMFKFCLSFIQGILREGRIEVKQHLFLTFFHILNPGPNEEGEVTLHFEDEEEFPDLAAVSDGDVERRNIGGVSYSDILGHTVS